MGDHVDATERLFRELMANRSPAERLVMATAMANAARRMSLAALATTGDTLARRRAFVRQWYPEIADTGLLAALS
ncbi:MAG: hypothetical protein NW201_15235 [Gemmatimonadales bacterium]|nr:hypothetical protein [Gemmatimonadales bacterium]